jgi:hypothetical protein
VHVQERGLADETLPKYPGFQCQQCGWPHTCRMCNASVMFWSREQPARDHICSAPSHTRSHAQADTNAERKGEHDIDSVVFLTAFSTSWNNLVCRPAMLSSRLLDQAVVVAQFSPFSGTHRLISRSVVANSSHENKPGNPVHERQPLRTAQSSI